MLYNDPEINDPSYCILLERYKNTSIPDDLKSILAPSLDYFMYNSLDILQNQKTLECKIIASYKFDDNAKLFAYFSNRNLDKLHRKDKPAFIKMRREESIRQIKYYENGIKHNLNGPQEITYSTTKQPLEITYRINDKIHRTDGPAITQFTFRQCRYFKHKEIYIINGKYHRTDGPSVIEYNVNGTTIREVWYRGGIIHRLNGPADISYHNENAYKKWCVNGKLLNRRKVPAFEDGILRGRVKLNQRSILEATIFDREYGTFLKEMLNKIEK